MNNQEGSPEEIIQLTPPLTSVDHVQVGGDTIQILLDFKEKGRNLCNQPPPSIYMVPSLLRDVSPSCFKPLVVSIGPLHREDENVQEFEGQKATYLHHLLDRLASPPEQTLEACLQKVNGSIDKIRACYAGMKTYTDVELAKMMVIDASFILEFLCPSLEHKPFILGNLILKHSILDDLVLLENQIPFFVLQDIFECTLMNSMQTSLTSMVLGRLQNLTPLQVIGNDVVGITPDHILGLFHKSFQPKNIMSTLQSSLPKTHHSALELDNPGVKFKPYTDDNWQMAMEFRSSWFACFCWCWSNPTLGMPVLHISDYTEQLLRNMIAYEQCSPDVRKFVTSYVCAMDDLVDTTEDLLKLVESKVLINMLGSNEDATNMINNICTQTVYAEFYYTEQWKQLDRYYNGYWPRNIARLKRTYFSNPWTIIALLAAFVLFALTALQTIFTVKTAI